MGAALCIEKELSAMRDEAQARHLMRFFKCAPGEYGDGDRFLGIRVPVTRAAVKYWKRDVCLEDCMHLVASQWHEIRLAGFLLMIELYRAAKKKKDEAAMRHITDAYLGVIERGNNWDLVDLVCQYILGDRLVTHPEERGVLDELAAMDGRLWHQRVAIVSTFALIRAGEFADTLRIAETLLHHPHDLIHKATGWMLREVGKRGGLTDLKCFLDRHATAMPRTMLRYAIERLPERDRQYYLKMK